LRKNANILAIFFSEYLQNLNVPGCQNPIRRISGVGDFSFRRRIRRIADDDDVAADDETSRMVGPLFDDVRRRDGFDRSDDASRKAGTDFTRLSFGQKFLDKF
jgi:hypothetical protein